MNISTANLKAALAPILPLATGRASLPILSTVRLCATGKELELQASNLDVHAISKTECDGELEPLCVSANALRYLTDSANGSVEFKAENGRLIVKSGWESKLPTLRHDDPHTPFPTVPEVNAKPLGVNSEDLARGVSGVGWAAALPNETRHFLKTIGVLITGSEIICRSCDGKHLCSYERPSVCAKAEFVLPDAYGEYLAAALLEPGSQITVGDKHVAVTHTKGSCIIRLVEESVPHKSYGQMTARDGIKEIGALNIVELLGHLQTALHVSTADFCYGHLYFEPKRVRIEFKDEKTSGEYRAEIGGKFAEHTIRIDAVRLIDVLKHVKSDNITLGYSNGNNTIRFEDGDFTFLLVVLTL